MSEVFILGRAAVFLTTRDIFGVLLASSEVRTQVLASVEVVKLYSASQAAVATVFANFRQLAELSLSNCRSLTALPERLGDCAALTTLTMWICGDCAALTMLNLEFCTRLPSLLDVAEGLRARGCYVLLLRAAAW